jgi:hypothetical protein
MAELKRVVDLIKPSYEKYAQGDKRYSEFKYELIDLLELENVKENVIKDILSLHPNSLYNADQIRMRFLILLIIQFINFGYCPDLLVMNEHGDDDPDNIPGIEYNLSKGMYWHYFMWRHTDEVKLRAPERLGITEQNFNDYKLNSSFDGWSVAQLRAVYDTTILPYFAELLNDKINIHNKIFKQFYIDKYKLYNIVKKFFNNKTQFDNDIIYIKDVVIKYGCTDEIDDLVGDLEIDNLIKGTFLPTYENYYCWRKSLGKDLWKKLSTKVKVKSQKKRFKWENLCEPSKLGDNLDLDELRELAILEGIPEYLFMSHRELCAELSKMFQNVIDGKKRITPKCINTTSILGEDIQDIPPEFFYSYTHNNKIYCDDIRDLYKHFETNGAKHPIDRSTLNTHLVNRVFKLYAKLAMSTNTMNDIDTEVQAIPESSILTSKLTDFISKLNYPNNQEYLKNAPLEQVHNFVELLVEEGILSNTEKRMLSIYTDPTKYKIHLIEMLLVKIKNDPQQINGLSTIAINTSNVYNEIFNEESVSVYNTTSNNPRTSVDSESAQLSSDINTSELFTRLNNTNNETDSDTDTDNTNETETETDTDTDSVTSFYRNRRFTIPSDRSSDRSSESFDEYQPDYEPADYSD